MGKSKQPKGISQNFPNRTKIQLSYFPHNFIIEICVLSVAVSIKKIIQLPFTEVKLCETETQSNIVFSATSFYNIISFC